MTTKAQQAEQAEALEKLRTILKPGDTLYTVLRNVSASGMSRAVSVVKVEKDGSIHDLSFWIARAGLFKSHPKYDGLKVDGCGMDMGFHVVYELSRSLYPKGYKCNGNDGSKDRKKQCRSNDHSNYYAEIRGQETPEPNYKRGKLHTDGGYALSQQWL